MTSVEISANYKKLTVISIISIIFFIFVYLCLLALAAIITILCGYAGYFIISVRPSFITLALGAGFISMGLLILFFLIKFIFKTNIVDRSHLIEIQREDQPDLFNFIEDIVIKTGTDFPKKVYLSPEVNACVFYDSSFWSMFFPVKKNLQIGIGLVNTISVNEFRAILSHEFGHFSQSTMKVGSYVYSVNKVIFNMLYDNNSYATMAQSLASVNGFIAMFVNVAFKIVQGIQALLGKIYEIVNINHLKLSREMEFQADEIAAQVTGSTPLVTSLLRMNLADYSYNSVLEYYNGKVQEGIKTKNLYPQQSSVLSFLATESKLPIENNFPQVSLSQLNKYNKSKLVIEDQWASHPSTEDRINALEALKLPGEKDNGRPAISLFRNAELIETKLTETLFATVTYSAPPNFIENNQFFSGFKDQYKQGNFSKLFNGYYDSNNPSIFTSDYEKEANSRPLLTISELFSDAKVEMSFSSRSLESDIGVIEQISTRKTRIKTFDYDGTKYTSRNCSELTGKLKTELEEMKKEMYKNDLDIFHYFSILDLKDNSIGKLNRLYSAYSRLDSEFEKNRILCSHLLTKAEFMSERLETHIIERCFIPFHEAENNFKETVQNMMDDELYYSAMSEDIKKDFSRYLSTEWVYFDGTHYKDAALEVLNSTINGFFKLNFDAHFNSRKNLLSHMESLEMEFAVKNDE